MDERGSFRNKTPVLFLFQEEKDEFTTCHKIPKKARPKLCPCPESQTHMFIVLPLRWLSISESWIYLLEQGRPLYEGDHEKTI